MNYLPKTLGNTNWSWLKIVGVIIVLAAIILLIVFLGKKNDVSESFQDLSQEEVMEDKEPVLTSENVLTDDSTDSMTKLAPQASEPIGTNEIFRPVNNGDDNNPTGLEGNQLPKDCYPKDQLTPSELLPGDPNTKWAQVNPSGQGDLKDQNFLNAGHHLGVNTVGQSLRNSNLQLRSEPPCPQVKVSPWMQTTIEPDTNRRPMEIGGCE